MSKIGLVRKLSNLFCHSKTDFWIFLTLPHSTRPFAVRSASQNLGWIFLGGVWPPKVGSLAAFRGGAARYQKETVVMGFKSGKNWGFNPVLFVLGVSFLCFLLRMFKVVFFRLFSGSSRVHMVRQSFMFSRFSLAVWQDQGKNGEDKHYFHWFFETSKTFSTM